MDIQPKAKSRASCINISGREDRLSVLPDAILCHILSFLPFESAITAALLSRRWQHLWTQLPSLTIHQYPNSSRDCTCRFWNKLDIILSKLALPLTRSLSLNLFYTIYLNGDASYFCDDWFRRVCGSHMQEIQITDNGCASLYRFVAPSTYIFQMQSLVRLDLGGGMFAWNLPSTADAISLPNLKKLSISVVCKQFELLGKLINSVPSLEYLAFWVHCSYEPNCHSTHYYDSVDAISLVCPNLKELYACIFASLRTKVIVDAPKLQYVNTPSHPSKFTFVANTDYASGS